MSSPFKIVEDSSLWQDPSNLSALYKREDSLSIGIVKDVINDAINNDLRYVVEVQLTSVKATVSCVMLRRFGGAYNYEDIVHRGYRDNIDNVKTRSFGNFDTKAGDVVLVAFISGNSRFGVIIGALTHQARKIGVKASDGPQYKSEFNGIETQINADGEYTLTFKGQPTNLKKLNNINFKTIERPTYDTKVGTTFLKIDKTGSVEINDNSQSNKQLIKIDKEKGTVSLISGQVNFTLTKASETASLKSKVLSVNSDNKVTVKTKETQIDSSAKISLKSPKIAIGKEGVELLDQLGKLIDAIGMLQPISPIGPCTPLKSTPTWSQVEQIKSKIKEITGSF